MQVAAVLSVAVVIAQATAVESDAGHPGVVDNYEGARRGRVATDRLTERLVAGARLTRGGRALARQPQWCLLEGGARTEMFTEPAMFR
jgi:hypothetical protein